MFLCELVTLQHLYFRFHKYHNILIAAREAILKNIMFTAESEASVNYLEMTSPLDKCIQECLAEVWVDS